MRQYGRIFFRGFSQGNSRASLENTAGIVPSFFAVNGTRAKGRKNKK
jgi:hypothetical protein